MKASSRLIHVVFQVAMLLAFLIAPASVYAAPPTGEAVEADAAVVTAPPAVGAPTTVKAGGGLRLREDPGLSAPIIFVLYNGETVYPGGGPVWYDGLSWTFVGVYRGGTYYQGFCASKYLANYGGYEPPSEGGLKVTAWWGLRLRGGPGTWYSIRRVAPYGTILQPTGVTQWGGGLEWAQIVSAGEYLWAARIYLVPV